MEVVTYSEARKNFKAVMERVVNDADQTVITRQGAEPVVMVSLSEWNAIQETHDLLSSPRNAARLRQTIAQLGSGCREDRGRTRRAGRRMRIVFAAHGWDDLQFWMSHDKAALKKLLRLIEDCCRSPYEGIRKPEPLKSELTGWWSRRIMAEHRVVYRVVGEGQNQALEIAQCRGHY